MEKKHKLIVYSSAKEDMEQIIRYISEELCNPMAALKQIDDINSALDKVCLFPGCCPFTDNEYVKDKTIRKLIVNNYIVFYRVKGEEVHVVRVIYGMRNYATLL